MVQKTSHISFHFLISNFSFKNRSKLKQFLLFLFKNEGFSVDAINYIFCTDDFLLDLNKKHLNHDTYTDIITFALSHVNAPVTADIYISTERVKENAGIFHTTFTRELHRVIFHGALHLCGYKDKTAEQSKKMRAKEEFYLDKYFVSRETYKGKN